MSKISRRVLRNDIGFVISMILFIPFYYMGYVLYFFSKSIMIISHILMNNVGSVRDMISSFWSVELKGKDIFK